MKFKVTAPLRTTVYDLVTLIVEAKDSEDAAKKVEEVLHFFPTEAHTVEGVSKAFIEEHERLETHIGDLSIEAAGHLSR